MFDLTVLDVALWFWALVGTVFCLTPPLLYTFGVGWIRIAPTEDPGLVGEAEDEPFLRLVEELQGLGFRTVGIINESVWFLDVIHWVKRFRVSYLHHAEQGCFAALYRLSPHEERHRVSLTTLTTDGGKVSTAFPGVGLTRDEERFFREELVKGDPVLLLQVHQQNVSRFLESRNLKVLNATLPDYAKIEEKMELRILREMDLSQSYILPALCFALPVAAAFTLLFGMVPTLSKSQLFAGSLGIGGTIYYYFVTVSLPKLLVIGAENTEDTQSDGSANT